MRVPVGDIHRLVSETVRSGESGESLVDKERHVAVSQIMHADALHTRPFATASHLPIEE